MIGGSICEMPSPVSSAYRNGPFGVYAGQFASVPSGQGSICSRSTTRPAESKNTISSASGTVAIVNDTLARHYWPDADPIGKRLQILDANNRLVQVVGVAKTTTYGFPGEVAQQAIYFPYLQRPRGAMVVLARTAGASETLVMPLRDLVRVAEVVTLRMRAEAVRVEDEEVRRARRADVVDRLSRRRLHVEHVRGVVARRRDPEGARA